jgi:hypothetical protein
MSDKWSAIEIRTQRGKRVSRDTADRVLSAVSQGWRNRFGQHPVKAWPPSYVPLCRFFPSTTSTSTLQETLCGEILIEVGPVYSIPGTGNAPVRPLLGQGM